MPLARIDIERSLAVFVGFLSMITSGSTYSFGAFTNAVKSHFNYTQTEVEFLSSMPNIGISFAFPAGIIIEKFGPRWSTLGGAVFSSLGYGLLYSTTFQQQFYHTRAWLQCVYFFVAGFGATFFYMTPLAINMGNYHPKHRGKVVGVMDASFSAGPAIFAAIYGTMFVKGHVTDEENQDLRGFYLLNIICSVAVGALALIFIKRITYDVDMEVTRIVNWDESSPILSSSEHIVQREITGLKLLKRFDFHYLSWACFVCAGLQIMFQNNLGTYLKSYGLESYTTLFTTLNPIAAIASKFVAGFLSDAIIHWVPRSAVLLSFNLVQTVDLIVCVFFANSLTIFLITDIVIGFANGAVWCLTPTMISEFYGMNNFSRNWGFIMLGNAVGGLVFQETFGVLYDLNTATSNQCYGRHCFTWSFIIIAVSSFCASILNIGLLQKKMDEKKYGRECPRAELCCL
uniref:Probable transporter MCH1 n=1 Tax=Crassostrea virginica TaxID=6565 RepID=A0A8B8E7L3_CRAVI|nr:probable transporter MCH1 [Crassostrea virginica]